LGGWIGGKNKEVVETEVLRAILFFENFFREFFKIY